MIKNKLLNNLSTVFLRLFVCCEKHKLVDKEYIEQRSVDVNPSVRILCLKIVSIIF